MPTRLEKMDMIKLIDHFASDTECRKVLEELRWPKGAKCLRCGSEKVVRLPDDRGVFDCYSCGYQFSVTAGTIFHDTHLPLRKWFIAIFMIVESKKGISANQMKRILNISYKTAWYLCHRIRTAMAELNPEPLTGIVEVDETFVGGKVRGKGHGYRGNKAIVVGAIQRQGPVRLQVIPNVRKRTLHGFIRSTVHPDAEAIYTDELPSYVGIGDKNTRHESVNHKAEEWVRGDVHTNTAESVWSLFDRSVIGAFHHVSIKHLDRYLDELEWRFNNRENPWLFRDTLTKLLASENLEYRELIQAT